MHIRVKDGLRVYSEVLAESTSQMLDLTELLLGRLVVDNLVVRRKD